MNYVKFCRRLLLWTSLLLLSACAGHSRVELPNKTSPYDKLSLLSFDPNLYPQTDVESIESLLMLSPAVKEDFLVFFNAPERAEHTNGNRLASYLGMLVDSFQYQEDTYSAQETLDNGGGNCLSLTLLTTALAKLANVDVSYDVLAEAPTFSLENSVLISSGHMRAVVYSKADEKDDFVNRKRIAIDYFDTTGMRFTRNVSTNYQVSLYYSNRAAEALLEDQEANAYAYALKAFEIDQTNDSALNTLSILLRRKGEDVSAEHIYQAAIAAELSNAALFYRQYMSLLKRQERDRELASLTREYERIEKQHPYEFINTGHIALSARNYKLARQNFDKAIRLAPEIHQLYLLSAKSSLAMGDSLEARNTINQAFETANFSQNDSAKLKLSKFRSKSKKLLSR